MNSDGPKKQGGADNRREQQDRPRGGFKRDSNTRDGQFRRDEAPRDRAPRREYEGGEQGWRPFRSPGSGQGGFRERDQPFESRNEERPRAPRREWQDRGQERGGGFENRPEGFQRGGRDQDRPFRAPAGGSDRPTYRQGRGGYRSYDQDRNRDRRPGGDRPAFNSRWGAGERPSFQDRRPGGDRPPYQGGRHDDRPAFGGERPSFPDARSGGDRAPYGGRPQYGDRRPFERRPEGSPFEGQGRPLGTSTRLGRPPVNQFEPIKADVYGRWPVLESLRAGNVTKVYLAAGVHDTADHLQEIQTLAAEKHIPVTRVERFALDKVLGNVNHQGIAAACRPHHYASLDDVLEAAKRSEDQPLVLLFDGVQDPQNLGSILRTAEAVGVDGALLPKHNQVGITPAVVRASAGAVEHLPIAEVTNLRQTVATLKESGYWIVGLDMDGGTDYDNFEVNSPIALVVGGEGRGLSRLVTEECDYLVRLPMRGHVGSLNASVAAGIVLYEIGRRRGATRAVPARAKARPASEPVAEDNLDDETAVTPGARASAPVETFHELDADYLAQYDQASDFAVEADEAAGDHELDEDQDADLEELDELGELDDIDERSEPILPADKPDEQSHDAHQPASGDTESNAAQ